MMQTTEDFVLRVTSKFCDCNLADIQEVYEASQQNDVVALQKVESEVGIDPMMIIAIIEILMTVVPLVIEWCNAPEKLISQSRIRNHLALRIFRVRVHSALKQAIQLEGHTDNVRPSVAMTRKVSDAMLDIAHTSGEDYVAAIVTEYRSL